MYFFLSEQSLACEPVCLYYPGVLFGYIVNNNSTFHLKLLYDNYFLTLFEHVYMIFLKNGQALDLEPDLLYKFPQIWEKIDESATYSITRLFVYY